MQPTNPEEPQQSEIPNIPVIPETPQMPDVSGIPNMPVIPDIPVIPEIPQIPSTSSGQEIKTTSTVANNKKKTYYVKVRAYKIVKGKRVFGAYSTVKKIMIKK